MRTEDKEIADVLGFLYELWNRKDADGNSELSYEVARLDVWDRRYGTGAWMPLTVKNLRLYNEEVTPDRLKAIASQESFPVPERFEELAEVALSTEKDRAVDLRAEELRERPWEERGPDAELARWIVARLHRS